MTKFVVSSLSLINQLKFRTFRSHEKEVGCRVGQRWSQREPKTPQPRLSVFDSDLSGIWSDVSNYTQTPRQNHQRQPRPGRHRIRVWQARAHSHEPRTSPTRRRDHRDLTRRPLDPRHSPLSCALQVLCLAQGRRERPDTAHYFFSGALAKTSGALAFAQVLSLLFRGFAFSRFAFSHHAFY